MTDPDPLAALLAEALTAAQYRYRSRLGTWGAAVSQPGPDAAAQLIEPGGGPSSTDGVIMKPAA